MTALELVKSNTLNEKNTNFITSTDTLINTQNTNISSTTISSDHKIITLNKASQEFVIVKPDLATPPQSPHGYMNIYPSHSISLPLISSHSLTSSTSSINSIDELEETRPPLGNVCQNMNNHKSEKEQANRETNKEDENPNPTLKNSVTTNKPDPTSKELVLSILDDIISNKVVTEETDNQLQEQNIQFLKEKIQKNNETLQESLKSSYKRLRLMQTKCFQTHVAQQLNNILELKEKQKLECNNKPESSTSESSIPVKGLSSTNTNKLTSDFDDTSVDLLTSILKSNLSDTASKPHNSQRDGVDAAVKSLLDDIQYEIQKQGDEKQAKKKLNGNSESDTDEQSDSDDESTMVNNNNDDSTTWKYCKSTHDQVNNNNNVNTQFKSVENPNQISTFEPKKVNMNESSDEHKKLTDSSNLFWAKSRAQLGSEWTRVQNKMKQLKLKSKQCNDYLSMKQNFIEKFESTNTVNENEEKLALEATSTENKSDEAAIAALSTSLQESVAAEVFAIEESSKLTSEKTSSRCLPYHPNKSSRLFNLNRSDLIELDDQVIKSFYYTLRYFSNTYFKTMCMCSVNEKSSAKKNNYYYQKKRKLLQEEENARNEEINGDLLNGKKKSKKLLAADVLSLNKTCIFCHLLKKYEQTRMDSASVMNNKARQMEAQKNRKQLELLSSKDKKKHSVSNQITKEEKNLEKSVNSVFADPDLVDRDHSYCKQSNSHKKNLALNNTEPGPEYCNKKQKLIKGPNEEALDELVGGRLNRIFNEQSIKTEKMEVIDSKVKLNESVKEDDELIDAGLDLTPDDLQKLPDFSYEELKFLNEIDLDKNTYRKKFEFVENSIDMSCENNSYDRDYASFLLNKSYPKSYMMNSELVQGLDYKPKYRSLLSTKRQKKSEQQEPMDLKSETKLENSRKRGRARLTKHYKEETVEKDRESNLIDKKDSWELGNKDKPQKNKAIRPRKRQRSTSSYSSSSSILSSTYNDSNYGDSSSNVSPASKLSGFYSNYFCNTQNHKFDIDNIVIPFDSSGSVSKAVNIVKHKNVPTPKWRELVLEPMLNITDEVLENLNESYFEELHKSKEKKRFENDKKFRLKHDDLSASLPVGILSTCLNDMNKKNSPSSNKSTLNEECESNKLNNSLNLSKLTRNEWMPRKFPLNDYEYQLVLRQDHLIQLNKSSDELPLSHISEHINDN